MTIYYDAHGVTLHHGDALNVLKTLPDASIDSVATDPPYGLSAHPEATIRAVLREWLDGDDSHTPDLRGFMGREWDGFVPPPAIWRECLRVLRPGGHIVVFSSPRTQDLMTLSMRLAGFEIRDTLAWLNSSKFPKSLNVAKAIERTDTPELAMTWEGFGTALKQTIEPITLGRKPLNGTVAETVLTHGTGALNIAASRIPFVDAADEKESKQKNRHADFGTEAGGNEVYGDYSMVERGNYDATGRWPTDVILDAEAAQRLDELSGSTTSGAPPPERGQAKATDFASGRQPGDGESRQLSDTGGASRFFKVVEHDAFYYTGRASSSERPISKGAQHNTVKPLSLMRWLVRLITPPKGVVLDCFVGSGTTAEAAILEGMTCVAVERETEHLDLTVARIQRQRDAVGFVQAGHVDHAEPTLFDDL